MVVQMQDAFLGKIKECKASVRCMQGTIKPSKNSNMVCQIRPKNPWKQGPHMLEWGVPLKGQQEGYFTHAIRSFNKTKPTLEMAYGGPKTH